VIISESTYRMVRGAFRVKQIQSLHLRGRKEPVQAYLVVGKLEQPTRMRYRDMGGVKTRLVGRQEEVLRLYSAYQRVKESSTPAWVLVSGEAGIGKSRLLMEFANRLEVNEPGVFLMSGRGMERTENVPFFLWKSLFHNRFGMSDNMPLDEACERFMKGTIKWGGEGEGNFSAEEAAFRIGDLIGLQWPEQMVGELVEESPLLRTRKAFQVMRELLGRVCNGGVVVLLLDDLQWADKRSLDLITYLVRPDSESLRMLALGGARPHFFRQDFPGKDLAEVIPLKPIPFNAEMVRMAYPALANVSNAVLRDLARRADGNPYFLEEMVKSLLMRKREVGETRYLTVPDYFPETLQAMLQARLDELPRDARDVAMLASVVGRVFWLDAVTTIARYPARTGLLHVPMDTLVKVVKSALDKLMLAEMVFPRAGSVFVGEQEFIFKHTLLRDAAYSRLPEKYRRLYHNVVAQWLRQRASPDFYARVAEHYELGRNQQESIKYYRMAAEYARSRGAEEEAEELQRRSKALIRDPGE
jgi:predicted ATPase